MGVPILIGMIEISWGFALPLAKAAAHIKSLRAW
jgi:hypothetical protein